MGAPDFEFRADLLDQSNEIVLVLDPDTGEIVYGNATAMDVLGYDEEDLLGTSITTVTGFDDVESWAEHLPQDEDADHRGENEFVRSDGERIPVEASVSRTTRDGEDYIVVLVRDITERKERESELRRQKERFEQLFETAGTIMVVLDEEGFIERINDRGSKRLGYERGELVGEHWFETVVPDDVEPEVQSIFEGITTGERGGVDGHTNYVETKDGTRRFVQWHNTPIHEGDEVVGILSSGIDITERKRNEDELERYESFVKSAKDVILSIDDDGFFSYVSPASNSVLGYDPDDLRGTSALDYVHPEEKSEAESGLRSTVDGDGDDVTREFRFQRSDGTWIWVEAICTGCRGGGSDDVGIAILRDITERKEYERELAHQRDALEVLNEVVRHDIRNQLQLVTAYAGMLEGDLEGENQEYAATIRESGQNAIEVTRTARDLAATMIADERVASISLRHAVESPLEQVRSAYSDAVFVVDGAIPDVAVAADEMLESVFRNLLQNAVQHNDKAVPRVEISATVDDVATVHVADNGPGVREDMKDDVFGAGETGLKSDSTGLGLYLVNTLVDRYGGTVHVRDNDPDGAIFDIELPLAE
ncbi:PAS domain-containing sensor histidine kinase [Halanaeroarchaeum sulfurireducens]|uniref:histidine kinase n=1 Tax=Halanaeroarchaeum sulfurireducens TaxID=1604004 RepID=A0A0F7PCD1_9EURY|nr:PAS domain-containing sensor histidine kinase [Halanaeroarchaeum sulfurireducens]AKH97279.1 signal-transducing histidine kinase [Halanaeroarchaeum sulfurireducens]ALG81681.1 signal-transducing histidine kinase [Halanaeroarchaeum sulfurireducens]